MADFTLFVSLNTEAPAGTPPVTVSPDLQSVPQGTQTIQWQIQSGQNGAIASICFGSGDPFATDPTFANSWTGTDNNNDTVTTDYPYTITVWYNNQPYSSDPEIENQSGGGASAEARRLRRRHRLSHQGRNA